MIQTLRNMVEVGGSKSHLMKYSLTLAVTVAVLQGVAYALLFPFFSALLAGEVAAWTYFAIILGLTVAEALFRLWGSYTEWRIYLEVANEARLNLAEQLKKIPLQILGTRRTGDLNHVLTGNVQEVVGIASGVYTLVINTMVAPTVTIIFLLFIDWRVALAMLIILPCAAPLYRLMRAQGATASATSATAHADTASEIIEYVQGLAVLRASRQVGTRSTRLQRSVSNLRKTQAKSANVGTTPALFVATVVQIGILAVTALAIYFNLDGTLSIAALCALVAVTIRFSEPLSLFASLAQMFDLVDSGLARMHEVMDIPALPHKPKAGTINTADVELHDVTFTYDNAQQPAISNLSLQFPTNSMTALVGPSGSGKTTVTKLIGRFADPQHGVVTIGNVDVRTLPTTEHMQHISVVFQDVYLFDDTIKENIRMARPSASDDEILTAARAANCHEFVARLPDGYNTKVGEIGSALSGGERQRISIARAILKDAPIVILDEPTSALDTESEVAVQAAIDALIQDRTVIVIAHRLSTVAAADNIIVMDNGQCIEQGTHDDLLTVDGKYRQLWEAQQSSKHWRMV